MPNEAGHPGLLQSLKNLAGSVLDTAQTRLALLSSELEEQRERLARIAVLAAICGFFLALAIVLATMFIVVLFWDTHRLLAIGVLGSLFLVAAVIAFAIMRAESENRPRLFGATIAEFSKDRERLQ